MEKMIENIKTVIGVGQAAASSLTEDAVSFENYDRCLIEIICTISSGTDTGAITILQSTDAAGSDDKAVVFTEYWKNEAVATADTLTAATATSNTFDIGGAAEIRHYFVEIMGEELDRANVFKFIRCNVADITNATITVLYHMYKARYGGNVANLKSAIA